jgi:nitrogen fixation/metabolism regulation signal transduction histidine kinase
MRKYELNLSAKTKYKLLNFITSPMEITADKKMIKTILRNLISNAEGTVEESGSGI